MTIIGGLQGTSFSRSLHLPEEESSLYGMEYVLPSLTNSALLLRQSMKDSQPRGFEFMIGAAITFLLLISGRLLYKVIVKMTWSDIVHFGEVILFIAIAVPIATTIGHIFHAHCYCKCTKWECVCGATGRYFFSQWMHNRRCLPRLVSKV